MAVLSTLMGFGSISTDLYLPALPTMARALATSSGAVEWTIGSYLLGFSFGQLLWGPLGDRYGRRLPVGVGLVLFSLGSAGCALAPGAWVMIGARVVQAIGACAGVVLARAMVRDLYPRDRAAQMLSTLITVMAIAPLLGPLVGGQILAIASWRVIFWLLVAVGLVTLAALFTVPETLPAERRLEHSLGQALIGYGTLLRDPNVIGYSGAGGLFYVGIYAYIAGTPFAYISYYGVPAQRYGLLFGASIAGIMAANAINARLVARLGSDRLLGLGGVGAAVTGLLSAVAAMTGWGGLAGLAISLLAYCAMSGLIVANSIAGALSRHASRAGAVSALVGALQYGVGIVGSGLVGAFADGTPRPLGAVVALGGVGCLACIRLRAAWTR
ncbi:MAG: multidrug effflux MFS transporter [Rhodospirillales bacterium]|nr:multidrug effflux MFS transporter [Rhodospirillales bacterium]MDE2198387.1 multidrug effflux MFS transporter [Rhodospirillales bacterium]